MITFQRTNGKPEERLGKILLRWKSGNEIYFARLASWIDWEQRTSCVRRPLMVFAEVGRETVFCPQ